MGKSEGSVKLLQFRAINRLRTLLDNQGKRRAEAIVETSRTFAAG
jgi:hypothetical protein